MQTTKITISKKKEGITTITMMEESILALEAAQKLKTGATTEEEITAYAAYRRVMRGAKLVSLICVLLIGIVTWLALSQVNEFNRNGTKRYGTVTQEGMIYYIQDEPITASPAQLGLNGESLQEGEQIVLYFDTMTDEFVCAYPFSDVSQTENLAYGSIFIAMIIVICLVVVYYIVCRTTSFGRPWYRYLKQQKQAKETLPPKVSKLLSAAAIAIAVLICFPAIQNLAGNIQRMNNIQERSNLIHEAADSASQAADDMQSVVDSIESTQSTEAISGVEEAVGNISDILGALEGASNAETIE